MTDTHTRLLDVAEAAARARGFDGFSYADLATAVNIRKASIHYHFPTKAALSAALMDRYHSTFEAQCGKIVQDHVRAADQLNALIDVYRDALKDGHALCLCVSFVASRESLSDEVMGQIAEFRRMVADWITEVFKKGAQDGSISGVADPAHEAHATLAVVEGAQLAARACQSLAQFDAAVSLLRARVGR